MRLLLLSLMIFAWSSESFCDDGLSERGPSANAVSELDPIDQRIESLPCLSIEGANGRGFHSEFLTSPSEPAAVVLDMFRLYRIDTIVLVPAVSSVGRDSVFGYGFPQEYRVQASTDNQEWVTVVESSGNDLGATPVIHEIEPIECRYLKILPTVHWQRAAGLWVFALAEFMAFEGNLNRALWADLKAASAIRVPPKWAPHRLCDGTSPVGIPLDRSDKVPTFGYRSNSAASQDEPKWVQVDLGREMAVREIRLIPAASPYDMQEDFGFPA